MIIRPIEINWKLFKEAFENAEVRFQQSEIKKT